MDFINYKFKDNRVLFKYLLYALALGVVNSLVSALKLGDTSFSWGISTFLSLFYIVMAIIVVISTRAYVFVNKSYIKANKKIPFMMIDEITATTGIMIKSDNSTDVIKVLDLESNYEKYKELLEDILSKVEKTTVLKSGSADKILENIRKNQAEKNKVALRRNGKPKIGGWLKLINVFSYFVFLTYGFTFALSIVNKTARFDSSMSVVQMGILAVVCLSIIILLGMRKKSVKYALAALPISSTILTVINSIGVITSSTGFLSAVLETVWIFLSIVTVYVAVKVYFEYIDNFDRPKQTLIN